MDIYKVIRLASNLSVALPLVIYVTQVRRVEKQIHLVGAFVLLCALADLITFFNPSGLSVALIFNIQDIVQFLLLAGFYYVTVYSKRKVISWGITFYLTVLIAVTLWVQGVYGYQTLMWSVNGVVMVVFAITYFMHLYEQRPAKTASLYGTLWINSGLLFYFAFSLWLFVMGDYILNELPDRIKMIYWSCHNMNNVTKNVLVGIGIFYSRQSS